MHTILLNKNNFQIFVQSIDETLTSTTISCRSTGNEEIIQGGSTGNEEIIQTPQMSRTGNSLPDAV